MCPHNKKAEADRYCAYCEVDRLTKALQIVRELHKPNPNYVGSDIPCIICKETLPCPTLKALDGDK